MAKKYLVKPHYDKSLTKTFDNVKDALKFVEKETGSRSFGKTSEKKLEEWVWIDKIRVIEE